ncbi:hypothetical protein MMC12_007244 [Toensbergia leucococca]|nr:hypothetical protein [Toensbergia leucococca]
MSSYPLETLQYMQSSKLTARLPQVYRITNTPTIQTRKMSSFIPRFASNDFAPLFHLLDDYDVHRSTSTASSSIRAFQPKFDVREVNNTYELDGELPGVNQSDINIEFSDTHTLTIKGRSEREVSRATSTNATTNGTFSAERVTDADSRAASPSHRTTVEDEQAADNLAAPISDDYTTPAVATEVASPKKKNPDRPGYKSWISERSVGEFHRSFRFPKRVDQDAVTASLKNGILSVTVPKAIVKAAKRIQVE